MSTNFTFPYCPEPPSWALCWPDIVALTDALTSLAQVVQDPEYHREGNVLQHTRTVCERLVGLNEWRALPRVKRNVVFAACLFHDLGKAETTRIDDEGRVTSRGHSRRGAYRVRLLLQELADLNGTNLTFAARETIVALIRRHGLPYSFLENRDPERSVFQASQTVRCDLLSVVAEADVKGRECDDAPLLLDAVELFRATCRDHDCFDKPKPFPSDHTRFVYFRSEDRAPDFEVYDDTRFTVTLMSGLPGAGKGRWIAQDGSGLPAVSLDALREELGVQATGNQGRVIQHAKELARQHLRQEQSFIWDATNVSQQMRRQLVDLFASYHARVRIVFVDAPMRLLVERNRNRAHPVPEKILYKLAGKLDLPDLTEAHEVCYVVDDQNEGTPLT